MVMKAVTQTEIRTIPAGEFKAKCLKLMDEAAATQRAITVTKRGKPVGQFVPMPLDEKPFVSIVGRSPGIKIPPNFSELRAALALDWADPGEKWARANGGGRRKKR